MNYYIIPKNKFNVDIQLQIQNETVKPYISYSLIFYLNDVYKQLFRIDDQDDDEITLEHINKVVNPYEFIHTNVPGTQLSVSKVKPESSIFFELMELFQLFNVNEILNTKYSINIAHLTPNHSSTSYLLNILREENNDNILCEDFDFDKLCNIFISNNYDKKLDLMICEFNATDYTDTNTYIKNMLLIFSIIIKYQSNNGTSIIKVDNIFYKAIVDLLFIFSAIYDKVLLVKPIISNITKGERYILCKGFLPLEDYNEVKTPSILNQVENKIINKLIDNTLKDNFNHVFSVINNDIPYYFLNKLEESNAVIGQQQLEAFDQIINIFKNKNREDKIETLKRNHIQKCIQWCEKNQLPHNKFIDQINIFLNSKKKDSDDEIKVEY
jgi:hypothetical protein